MHTPLLTIKTNNPSNLSFRYSPPHIAEFHGSNGIVCILDWSSGKLIVTGDYDEGAKILFEHLRDIGFYATGKPLPRLEE